MDTHIAVPHRDRQQLAPARGVSAALQTPGATLALILLVAAATALLFALDPGFDTRFVALFYDPERRAWPYVGSDLLQAFRKSNTVLTWAVALAAAGALLARPFGARWRLLMPARVAGFLLLTLAFGPGLLTNSLLKPYWGRPRPQELIQFGETLDFVAWWNPLGKCPSNCSFVSGEASSAFWLLAVVVVLPERYRVGAALAVIAYALAIGLSRIAMGGHFITDVVFAGVFTALIIWLVHGIMFRWAGYRR